MEFDIKELTITLMVGAFTILGSDAILEYLWPLRSRTRPRFPDLFAKPKSDKTSSDGEVTAHANSQKEQTITVVLFIVIAFGIGIFVEDFSDKVVYDNWFLYASLTHLFHLPSEGDDRALSLIKSFKEPKPESLARDLATNDAFCISDAVGIGKKIQKWILMDDKNRCAPNEEKSTEGCPSQKDIEASAANLYFYAKNTVYKHHDSYDELRSIEDRIRLVRSISVMAYLFALIAIGLWILNLFLRRSDNPRKFRWNEPFTAGIFCLISLGSIWAYGRECDAFNKRAFGYFSTMLVSEKRQREQDWLCPPLKVKDDSSNENQKMKLPNR